MPPQPKPDKHHIDRVMEGLDKIFHKGENNPEKPKDGNPYPGKMQPPKTEEKPKR